MWHFHIRSVTLGVGIGMVATALLTMAYVGGLKSEIKALSNEKNIGEEYIVFNDTPKNVVVLNDDDDIGVDIENQIVKEDSLEKETEEIEVVSKVEEQRDRVITIKMGDGSDKVSEKLLNQGLIGNLKEFENEIERRKLQTRIQVGTFTFAKDSTVDEIITKVTTVK